MKNKLVSIPQLGAETEALRAQGKRIVATNGCFDLLHVGHVRYLTAARRLGDALVVGVNGDSSVRGLKGSGRPVNSADDRAEILAALECVDLVAIFPEVRATNFLRAARPAIYAKGGDYTPDTLDPEERQSLAELGARVEIIPFEKGYSTSSLLEKIARP